MNRKLGIGAVSTGQNNWQPRNATAWQRDRKHGKILPMNAPRTLWQRVTGR